MLWIIIFFFLKKYMVCYYAKESTGEANTDMIQLLPIGNHVRPEHYGLLYWSAIHSLEDGCL
jgi:hypothetical protein